MGGPSGNNSSFLLAVLQITLFRVWLIGKNYEAKLIVQVHICVWSKQQMCRWVAHSVNTYTNWSSQLAGGSAPQRHISIEYRA